MDFQKLMKKKIWEQSSQGAGEQNCWNNDYFAIWTGKTSELFYFLSFTAKQITSQQAFRVAFSNIEWKKNSRGS